jgi:hypothetical protein
LSIPCIEKSTFWTYLKFSAGIKNR